MTIKLPGKLKKKLIKVTAFLCLLIIPLSTIGCWDKKELEDQAFAQVVGVDRIPGGVLVTVMFAIPSKMGAGGGGGGGGGDQYFVTSIKGTSVLAALNLMNGYLDRRVNLMHTKAVIVGEDEAKKGTAASLGALMRYREIRRTINIIVARGKAADLIKSFKSLIEANPAKWFEEMGLLYTFTGFVPKSLYHYFLLRMESPSQNPVAIMAGINKQAFNGVEEKKPGLSGDPGTGANYLAGEIPRIGGNKIELLGSAVFRGDKMVGTLTGDETRMLMMIRGEFRRAFMAFRDPIEKKKYIPIDIRQGSLPIVKIDLSGEKPRIHVKLMLEGDIMGIQSRYNYSENDELRMKLNRHVEEAVNKLALDTIHRAQNYKSDIFGFGSLAQKSFFTTKEWEEYRWLQKFPDADSDVEVSFNVRRVGMQFAQPMPRE